MNLFFIAGLNRDINVVQNSPVWLNCSRASVRREYGRTNHRFENLAIRFCLTLVFPDHISSGCTTSSIFILKLSAAVLIDDINRGNTPLFLFS